MDYNVEIYVGLSVWHAATLYAGFIENRINAEGLTAHIKRKNSYSATDWKEWRKLHKAVEAEDIEKIKKIAMKPVERAIPWPRHWVTIGKEFERTFAIG